MAKKYFTWCVTKNDGEISNVKYNYEYNMVSLNW
jgi:hypothetical protein